MEDIIHYQLNSTCSSLIGYADGLKKYAKGGYAKVTIIDVKLLNVVWIWLWLNSKEIENSVKIGDEVTVIQCRYIETT